MVKNDTPKQNENVNFNIDPYKSPVYTADSYLIASNEQILTFNFAQSTPMSNQQNIVVRVSLTIEQAKQFLGNLNDHIQKFER